MATIFSRIIAGEIPCYKIAENDRFFAFLDEKLSGCKAFQDDEKRPRMLINLHNIFQRGEITEPELNTLYGIINYLSQK